MLAKQAGARIIIQPAQGHGMALKTGLQAASDMIITMDCDLTYPADSIPTFIHYIEQENYDLVAGCRINSSLKQTMPLLNKLANKSFASIVRLLYQIDTHDVTTGMFAIKQNLARFAWTGNLSLPAEIIIRSRLMQKKYKEIPIQYKARTGDTTLHRWQSGKAYLRCFLHWKYGWFKQDTL